MTDRRKKEFLTSGIVVLAVILAYSFRFVGRGDFYPTLFLICAALSISAFMPHGDFPCASVLCKGRSDVI